MPNLGPVHQIRAKISENDRLGSYIFFLHQIRDYIPSTMCKILLSGYHSKKRNGNPPRMWSNASKIGFATIYDTFRILGFSPVLYTRL